MIPVHESRNRDMLIILDAVGKTRLFVLITQTQTESLIKRAPSRLE
jgi:hypothetical protein